MENHSKGIELLISGVLRTEEELKKKEEVLIKLRIRLRNIYHASGKNCFVCAHLGNDPFCKPCDNHQKFKFMLSEVDV